MLAKGDVTGSELKSNSRDVIIAIRGNFEGSIYGKHSLSADIAGHSYATSPRGDGDLISPAASTTAISAPASTWISAPTGDCNGSVTARWRRPEVFIAET